MFFFCTWNPFVLCFGDSNTQTFQIKTAGSSKIFPGLSGKLILHCVPLSDGQRKQVEKNDSPEKNMMLIFPKLQKKSPFFPGKKHDFQVNHSGKKTQGLVGHDPSLASSPPRLVWACAGCSPASAGPGRPMSRWRSRGKGLLRIHGLVRLYIGYGPFPVTVTFFIITFLVGNPELNLYLPLLLGKGHTQPIYL